MMKILGWIIALPFIFLGVFRVLRFAFCRPNYFVVKTATPVVEKIADYIVENGVPERLDEILDLPYKLEECSVNNKMWDEGDNIVISKKEAVLFESIQNCYFFKNNTKYRVSTRFTFYSVNNSRSAYLRIKSGKTTVGISFKINENNKLTRGSVETGYLKTSGICQSFKQ